MQKRTDLRDTEKVEWTGLGCCLDVSSRLNEESKMALRLLA